MMLIDLGDVGVGITISNIDKVVDEFTSQFNDTLTVGLIGRDEPIYAPVDREASTSFPFGANTRKQNLLDLPTFAERKKSKKKKEKPEWKLTTGKFGKRVMARDTSRLWHDEDDRTWTRFQVGDAMERHYHIIPKCLMMFKNNERALSRFKMAYARYKQGTTTAGRDPLKVLLEQAQMIIIDPFLKRKFGHNSESRIKAKGFDMWGVGSGQTILDGVEARLTTSKRR